jgi:hypothetical protein
MVEMNYVVVLELRSHQEVSEYAGVVGNGEPHRIVH